MSSSLLVGRHTARVRRVLAHHRWMRWVPLVAGCSGLVFAVHGYSSGVDAVRDAWGETRTVWVADRDHEPGESLAASARELPVVAVPADAMSVDEPVDGRTVRQRVTSGEVVTDTDIAGRGTSSLIPDGWRAIAISEAPSSGASVGDVVDLVSDGVVIADRAIVIDHLDGAVLVAVDADAAPLVALAVDTGVTILRTPYVGTQP